MTTLPTKPTASAAVFHSRRKQLRARYDAAQTTAGNSRHWSMADALSADAATNPGIRRILRNRAQYEYDNNGYCRGIVNTIANDNVGIGPQLQLRIGQSGLAVRRSQKLEKAWAQWAWRVNLAEKMRLMCVGQKVRGEVLAKTFNNGGLGDGVDLDVEVIEADQLTGQSMVPVPNYYDGVHYDTFGNPTRYEIVREVLGSTDYTVLPDAVDTVDARYVFHHFKRDRPGQRRGISEITAALPLFATARRYTLATLEASETAANHAGVFTNDGNGGEFGDDPPDTVAMADLIELERNGGVVAPKGWNFSQLKPEQPTTTYGDFIWAIYREIARVLDVPVTIALLDSSRSNLSAAYLDHQTYRKARVIERDALEGFLDWLLAQWIDEARFFYPELRGVTLADLSYTWRWPAMGDHADPSKVANAQAIRLSSGLTSIAREISDDGLDWEQEQQTAADSLGIPLEEYRTLLRQKIFANGNPPADAATPPNDQPNPNEPAVTPQPRQAAASSGRITASRPYIVRGTESPEDAAARIPLPGASIDSSTT